jgi:hypothetical protein
MKPPTITPPGYLDPSAGTTTNFTYTYPVDFSYLHAYVSVMEELRSIMNDTEVSDANKKLAQLKLAKYLELL